MESVGKIVGIFTLLIGAVISRAFAVSLTWNLFMPQFFGVSQLPVLIAIAIFSLLEILKPNLLPKRDKDVDEKDLYKLFVLSYILPWTSYLVALLATSIYF